MTADNELESGRPSAIAV